jgi:hypothetical protein
LNRTTLRTALAVAILTAWGAGVVAFTRREMGRSPAERMAEIALRVPPGATYFTVERDGHHIGFASTTIDTMPQSFEITEYQVTEADGGREQRRTSQTTVRLSRALTLREFESSASAADVQSRTRGRIDADTVLVFTRTRLQNGRAHADSQRVALARALVPASLAPLVVVLGEEPRAGKAYEFPSFDPMTGARRNLALSVGAESLFAVVDSAVFDPTRGKWTPAHIDSIAGWRLVTGGEPGERWVDAQGRMLLARTAEGLTLRRTAYEMAFENWRTASPEARAATGTKDPQPFPTLGEAGGRVAPASTTRLVVRLQGADLAAFELSEGSQRRSGDTVTVEVTPRSALPPSFSLPPSEGTRQRFGTTLGPGPLVEVDDPSIGQLARLETRGIANPLVAAERLARWVADSVALVADDGLPSAAQVLRTRRGDSEQHTQLFVALARAAGVPARGVVGVLEQGGTLHYHAWAEVFLQRWIPVDPTLGESPASAAHVRFLVNAVGTRHELTRVLRGMQLDVLVREAAPAATPAAATR